MAYSPQNKITDCGRLLNDKGQLSIYGWSESLCPEYDRSVIHYPALLRVREWDRYTFGNEQWQFCISIADNSTIGVFSVTATNLQEGWSKTNVYTEALTMGRYEMPCSGLGDIVHRSKEFSANISVGAAERRITMRCPHFDDVRELYITAVFHQHHEDCLSVAIPFKNKNDFFLSRTMACMPVSATVRYGGIETSFDPKDTFGIYRWCRSVMPSKVEWISCIANGVHEGERFGLCLGEGFGNRSHCGENAFFYKDRVYKIGELDITVPSDPDKASWTFIGEEGDVNLRMVPIHSHQGCAGGLGFVKMNRHRVFGKYYGTVMLRSEDGTVQRLVLDGITGFCERVWCRW